jgi:hypothetical protein
MKASPSSPQERRPGCWTVTLAEDRVPRVVIERCSAVLPSCPRWRSFTSIQVGPSCRPACRPYQALRSATHRSVSDPASAPGNSMADQALGLEGLGQPIAAQEHRQPSRHVLVGRDHDACSIGPARADRRGVFERAVGAEDSRMTPRVRCETGTGERHVARTHGRRHEDPFLEQTLQRAARQATGDVTRNDRVEVGVEMPGAGFEGRIGGFGRAGDRKADLEQFTGHRGRRERREIRSSRYGRGRRTTVSTSRFGIDVSPSRESLEPIRDHVCHRQERHDPAVGAS